MSTVAIVGAGELGGALARALAVRERVRQIRLIDQEKTVAAGKALDIQQAGPVDAYDTRVGGTTDLSDAVGAAVLVLADRADASGEWSGDPALMLIRRLLDLGVTCPIIVAGASARELIERAIAEIGIDRGRLIGSAPEALGSAIRAFVALEANGSPADVRLSVVGVPPKQAVVPWSDASIGGFSATRVLDAAAIARIDRRVPALWPPGPYALAAAAARLTEAIVCGSRRAFCAFADVDGRGRCASVPVFVNERGLARVVIPELDARERVVFENSVWR
jgi:malate dehydrogenase